MRDLSETLLAAQKTASVTPYIRVHLVHGATEYTFALDDSPNRIVDIESREEVFGSYVIVTLLNDDYYFNSKNLRGYLCQIGWGAVTGSGNEYSDMQDMWVLTQKDDSVEGKLVTKLICIDNWNLLSKDGVFGGGKKLIGTVSTDGSAYLGKLLTGLSSGATGIIYSVSDNNVLVCGVDGTFTTETATGNDISIVISSVEDIGAGGAPLGWAEIYSVEDISTVLLADVATITIDEDDPDSNFATYVPNYLVPLGTDKRSVLMDILGFTECSARFRTGVLHIKYLDPSPASYDYEYGQAHHAFITESRERSIVTPNRIFVTNVYPSSNLGSIEVYVGYAIDTDSYNAIGRYLSRVVVNETVGSNEDATARAEALINRQIAESNSGNVVVPIMNFGQELLDWIKVTDFRSNDLIIEGRVGYIIRRFHVGKDYAYHMEIGLGSLSTAADVSSDGSVDDLTTPSTATPTSTTPETIPSSILAPGAQAYIASVEFSPVDWDDVSWTAGQIKVKSGQTQTIDSGSKHFDNANPYYAYYIWGNSTLQWTQDAALTTGEDRGLVAVAERGTDSNDKAYVANHHTSSIVINRDKVMDNLVNELKIAASAVTEAKLAAGAVTEGKIAALAVTAGKIAALAVSADKIAANAVTADKIYAGSVTAVKIDAGAIDATKLAAEIVLASTIWAGDNKVKLSSSGIEIRDNTSFKMSYGVSYAAYMYVNASGNVVIQPAGGYKIEVYDMITSNLQPDGHETRNCGYSNKAWLQVVAKNLYSDDGSVGSYQHHDDLALLKGIKSKKNEDGRDVLDAASLPEELFIENDNKQRFVNVGGLHGLSIGIMKALLAKIEALEDAVSTIKGGK